MLETVLAMDPNLVVTFAVAGILLNLTPGADVAFVTASGLSGGPQAGFAAALGIKLGGLTHLALAVFGLSAMLMAVPHAYDVIRYIGAAYLLYLAAKTWRAAPFQEKTGHRKRFDSVLKRGFVTNILNPKVALFILAFLPQFIEPTAGPIWQQMLILGLIFNFTGLIINSIYGVAAGLATETLKAVSGPLNKFTSIIFGGLAVRLIWE